MVSKPHIPTSLTDEDITRMEANVPSEMRDANNWCCYKIVKATNGRLNKIPCDMHGKTITGFKAAFSFEDLASENKKITGLGFAIRPPFAAWDIDHCLVNGKLENKEILDDLYKVSSYTEVSPSCTGLHVFFESKQPKWVIRQKGCDYELYYNNRFVTVTGYVGKSFNPSFRKVDEDAIKQIYSHMDPDFGKEKTHEKERGIFFSSPRVSYTPKTYNGKTGGTDAEVISRLYEYPKSEKLFTGDWTDVHKSNGQPFGSQSEADIALLHCIAVQTGYDWYQSDNIFRKSALMRDKWDEYRGEVTYGELTMLQEFESSSHRENIPEEVRRRAP